MGGRVAVLVDYLSPYAIPSVKADAGQDVLMCEAFARAGHDVRLYRHRTTISADIAAHYGTDDIFEVVDLRVEESPDAVHPAKSSRAEAVRHELRRMWAAWRAVRRSRRSALVYTRDPVAALLAATRGRRVIWEAMSFPDRLSGRFVRALLRHRRLVAAIAITDRLAEDLHREFGGRRPTGLPVGVDLRGYAGRIDAAAHRSAWSLPEGTPLAVYTGFMRAERGIDVVVRAAALLPQVCFVLVGGRDDEVESLRDLALRVGAGNVRFIGLRPPTEMPAWQQVADVLLLPQRPANRHLTFHVSPAKLFEYFAAGRPVLAADLPCIREIIKGPGQGVLVDPEDPVAWAAACLALLEDDRLRQSLAEASVATASRYTWDARVASVLGLLAS